MFQFTQSKNLCRKIISEQTETDFISKYMWKPWNACNQFFFCSQCWPLTMNEPLIMFMLFVSFFFVIKKSLTLTHKKQKMCPQGNLHGWIQDCKQIGHSISIEHKKGTQNIKVVKDFIVHSIVINSPLSIFSFWLFDSSSESKMITSSAILSKKTKFSEFASYPFTANANNNRTSSRSSWIYVKIFRVYVYMRVFVHNNTVTETTATAYETF